MKAHSDARRIRRPINLTLPSRTIVSPSDLGTAIRTAREVRGMTQIELAKAAGLRQACVSDIENQVRGPRFVTILSLLRVLNLDLVVKPSIPSTPEDFASRFHE